MLLPYEGLILKVHHYRHELIATSDPCSVRLSLRGQIKAWLTRSGKYLPGFMRQSMPFLGQMMKS
jgi:hypothetical protein